MPKDDENGNLHIGDLKPSMIALLRQVATESATAAVRQTFISMGLDPNDPIASQESFAALRIISKKMADAEFLEDLSWVRRTREHAKGLLGKGMLTAVALGVGAFFMMAWSGLKDYVFAASHPPVH